MNSRYERFAKLAPLLRRLKHSVGKKRRDIIRKCDNDLIYSLSECCHNALKGNVFLTPAQKVKIRQHKHNLRKLWTKNTSIKRGRRFYNESDFSARWVLLYLAYLAAFLMGHARKMVLVDPCVLKQLKIKSHLNMKTDWKRNTLDRLRRKWHRLVI